MHLKHGYIMQLLRHCCLLLLQVRGNDRSRSRCSPAWQAAATPVAQGVRTRDAPQQVMYRAPTACPSISISCTTCSLRTRKGPWHPPNQLIKMVNDAS